MRDKLRGLVGPLVKFVLFGLVTILASYVLISTIINAGYGEHAPTARCSATSPAWRRATTYGSPGSGSAR